MMKALFIFVGALFAVTPAFAQSEEAARERSRQALDAAMDRARAQAKVIERQPAERPRGMQLEDLRRMQGVDPGELAGQYKELVKASRPTGPDLLVFVSASMPIQTLTRLAHQVRQAGGVMVFRGIKGGLTKKALNEWLGLLKPVAETGASMQINPESFERYGVNAVPTFVVATTAEGGCSGERCSINGAAVAGDVSLDYALEKISTRGGQHGKIADSYLSKLAKK